MRGFDDLYTDYMRETTIHQRKQKKWDHLSRVRALLSVKTNALNKTYSILFYSSLLHSIRRAKLTTSLGTTLFAELVLAALLQWRHRSVVVVGLQYQRRQSQSRADVLIGTYLSFPLCWTLVVDRHVSYWFGRLFKKKTCLEIWCNREKLKTNYYLYERRYGFGRHGICWVPAIRHGSVGRDAVALAVAVQQKN